MEVISKQTFLSITTLTPNAINKPGVRPSLSTQKVTEDLLDNKST